MIHLSVMGDCLQNNMIELLLQACNQMAEPSTSSRVSVALEVLQVVVI